MKLALLVLVAGCAKSSKTEAPPPPVVAPVAAIDAAAIAPIATDAIPVVFSDQLVTAIVPDWTSTAAELRLWHRDRGEWKLVRGPWPGVVGVGGTAWGIGLHGSGAPSGRDGPVKREGDGKSPAGAFSFRKSYGYAVKAPRGTTLAYERVDDNWKCVDDPASSQYTKIFDARGTAKDWRSAEDMRRKDELYTWVVDVAHNPAGTQGKGSCIFLHVWRGPDSSTVGCTAMDEAQLANLIAELEPSASFVLLPRAEYDALADSWGLPLAK